MVYFKYDKERRSNEMTKETANAIKQLIPTTDYNLIMQSSINNASALLKLYKLNNNEIKLILNACALADR